MSKGGKTLSSFLRAAVNSKTATDAAVVTSSSSSSSSISKLSSSCSKKTLKPISKSAAKRLRRRSKSPPPSLSASKVFPPSNGGGLAHSCLGLKLEASVSDHEDGPGQLLQDITSALNNGDSLHDSEEVNDHKDNGLEVPWFSSFFRGGTSRQRKEKSRDRKQRWIFKSTQVSRFDRLVGLCGKTLGTSTILSIFGTLGHETGQKEYNSLIKFCVDTARTSKDEDSALEQISRVYHLLDAMREQGFHIGDGTFSPVLLYFIDMEMEEEFLYFSKLIKDANPKSSARVGYYEMCLYIKANNEKKIQELCRLISSKDMSEMDDLRENYLLALCEGNRKDDVLHLLENVDLTKISTLNHVVGIFKYLGSLSVESVAKKFLFALKKCDYVEENISTLISSYATGISNLAVEDVILKFESLHKEVEITPFPSSYEQLIVHSCHLQKVHVALGMVEQMLKASLPVSLDTIHSLLDACEESFEYNLVRRIYSLICSHDLKPNNETFRSMMYLTVRMKDFEGAYNLLGDLEKFSLKPTAPLYNSLMAGYFREKNLNGALMAFKQMEHANVRPDSQTYSYLICNCDNEEQIMKYYEEMKSSQIQVSKQAAMSLINAYANCGQFEKAKEVLFEKGIQSKHLNELRNVLATALASNGQMTDALEVCEDIRQTGCNLEPKTVMCLIEQYQNGGDLKRMLELLDEITHQEFWVDGCYRIVAFCIRNKFLDSTFNLLKQLKDLYCNDEVAMDVLFDEVFSLIAELDPPDVKMGLELLQVIKVKFDITPSRKSLDFLLNACVEAKDWKASLQIWKEYEEAGLTYNVLSYLRMYQALLASGHRKSAKKMLSNIPRDDPHVCILIQACQRTYLTKKTNKQTQK